MLASSPTPNFGTIYEAYNAGNYSQRLSPADCINANGLNIVSGRRNILAITEPVVRSTRMSPSCGFAPSANDTSSYHIVRVSQPLWNGSSVLAFENHGNNLDLRWLCWGYDDFVHMGPNSASCDRRKAQSLLVENGTWYLRPFDTSASDLPGQQQAYPVKYCLSEDKVPEKCQL